MSKLNILIVDDDGPILKALSFRFQHSGFGVLCAKDGISALNLIATEQPAIAILDINLPGIDGFSLGEKIKEISEHTLPVLYMSASKSDSVLNHPSLRDALAFYEKPFNAKELVLDVTSILDGRAQVHSVG